MWELQVFLHPVPDKVPVHKMQSCTKMYNVEPGKHSCLTHANAAVIQHIASWCRHTRLLFSFNQRLSWRWIESTTTSSSFPSAYAFCVLCVWNETCCCCCAVWNSRIRQFLEDHSLPAYHKNTRYTHGIHVSANMTNRHLSTAIRQESWGGSGECVGLHKTCESTESY